MKRSMHNGLLLAVVLSAGFGSTFRLLVDDAASPGPGGLALFCSALLCLGLLGVGSSFEGRVRLRSIGLAGLALCVILAGAATSLFASASPFESASTFFPLAGNLLFFLVVIFSAGDREFGKFILKGALGVALVQCALGIQQFYQAPPGADKSPFLGTALSSERTAALIAMMVPVAAGLLVNSIHEHMDRSIWPRRFLYSSSVVLLLGGLYYSGSELAWIALALGMVAALFLVGKTYLGRNRKTVLAVGLVVLLLSVGAAAIQTQDSYRIPGYGSLSARLTASGTAMGEALEKVGSSPFLGRGFDERDALLPGAIAPSPPGGGPALLEYAALGGAPAAAALFFLLVAGVVHFWRSREPSPVGKLEARVIVGRRRELKAIDLATAGTAGGTAAIIAILFLPTSVFPATTLALFFPVWVLVLMTSFSYKHFRLQVENQRDFVAIGAAAGAVVGTIRSLVSGDLLHPPSQFLILLLLAAALSRRGRPEDLRVLDFRSPKILRPLLGLICFFLSVAAIVLGLWDMDAEIGKSALASSPPPGEGPVEVPRAGGPSKGELRTRVRAARRLARHYSLDARLWSVLGTTRLEMLRKELWEGDESGWEGGLAEAAEAFRRSREHSRSHRLLGREGWAWLSTAVVTHSPNPELLRKARQAFEEAARTEPRHAPHVAGLGETLHGLGMPEEGDAALRKALALDEEGRRMDRLPPELEQAIRARLDRRITRPGSSPRASVPR